MFDQADTYRFVRQGTPTPVQPDFGNLQSQWATVTPSGVEQSAYAATFTASIPKCPAFTPTGWAVDPSAALPTIGAAGVSAGMPSGVPKGSITAPTTPKMSSTSLAYSSAVSPSAHGSASATESGSAATSSGAAGKTAASPIRAGDLGFTGMVAALLAVGAAFILL
jgi:1,3-beta-glucanosyltransferase GAS1